MAAAQLVSSPSMEQRLKLTSCFLQLLLQFVFMKLQEETEATAFCSRAVMKPQSSTWSPLRTFFLRQTENCFTFFQINRRRNRKQQKKKERKKKVWKAADKWLRIMDKIEPGTLKNQGVSATRAVIYYRFSRSLWKSSVGLSRHKQNLCRQQPNLIALNWGRCNSKF